jgi:hypothetical protein
VPPARIAPSRRRTRRIWVAAAALVALAACSGGGTTGATGPVSPRPSSPAKLTIVSPTNGQVVHGSTLRISVDLTGAHIVQATSTDLSPTQGHLHVYLDGNIVGMNYSPTGTVGGITPGIHVLRVDFVASDHLPFDPPVTAQTAFEAKA